MSRCSIRSGAKSASRRRWPSMTRSRTGRSYTSMPSISEASSRSFGREQHAGPSKRLGYRSRRVGEDRHVRRHRFDERNAKPFVLAQRHVDVGPTIERREILVRNRPGEPEAIGEHLKLRNERPDLRVIRGDAVVSSDENEPVVAVDVTLVEFRQPDMVVDALVRDNAADEEES